MKRTLMTSVAVAMLISNPAHAAVSNEQLLQKLEDMQQEIKQLKLRVRRAEAKAITADAKASETKVTMSPAPKFESADGKNVFKVGGFVQADMANFANDKVDHPNGTNVRRARMNISGTVAGDWNYKLESDFAANNTAVATTITDAFIEYTGFRPVSLMVGQFKEPFGLETLNSDLHTDFIERASLNAFSPDRRIGAAVSTNGGLTDDANGAWYTASAGFFGAGSGTASVDDEANDITGRVTVAPWAAPGKVLHLGVAGSHRVPDSASDSYRVQSRAENSISSLQAVDTLAIANVKDIDQYGLELAGVWGPVALQSEYMQVDVARDEPGLPDLSFDGWYGELSYFLTGESRTYVKEQGKFDRTPPLDPFNINGGGPGAWAVMARVSNLDLNDTTVGGGNLRDYTVGVKWIPVPNVMFSANYIWEDTDALAVTADDDPQIFMMRAQFDL